MKYAIGIEYSGADYCGWQRQSHCESVQQNVESALGFVANHPLELICAGRTDSGVHAIEQVAHFETSAERSERAWVLGSNCRLPPDIRLKWAVSVTDDFHARFSARSRAYRYIILNSPVPSAIFHDRCSWEFQPLDQAAMHDCAQILVGEHDFSSFRAAGCQSRSPNRNVHEITVTRQGELIFLDIRANAFLYHMVRNIAGSLVAVGKGEQDAAWFAEVFGAGDRKLADKTAAASGLYFLQASYDAQYKLPTLARNPVLF
jgi:tRNA pseudouridine38-40 synthase